VARRIVVIGADAAGMSTASQALRVADRRGERIEVVALERSHHTSYSACGIPYWVAGDITDQASLVARSAEQHQRNGIDLRMRHEATELDLDAGVVEIREADSGTSSRLGFDEVVIATGGVPVRPDLPGSDAQGVFGVQTLDDGARLIDWLDTVKARRGSRCRAVVVGGGYIGVEMSEAMLRHGCEVRIVDRSTEPMSMLDPDMGALVRVALEDLGVAVIPGAEVRGFEVVADADSPGGRRSRVAAVVTDAGSFDADIVVLGMGIRANSDLAAQAGLPTGVRSAISTDARMAVSGHDGVWAAGDCVESFDRVSRRKVHVALGTHANKQGRVLGTNVGGGYARFPGIVKTAVAKVCGLEIATTGLREKDAQAAGFRYTVGRVESTTRAGYFPGAAPITVKMLAEQGTGRLLGAQIVGHGAGSAKRIDACALALWNEMTASELAMSDLSYAPPFSPVWDPIQIAARRAAESQEWQ
jgi:NADPH-dependent 2,4-dienoyl-CoA reductase/sulfur reductase-like enzyme